MTELYPEQVLALRKLSNGKILWGGTGSGKTPVAARYYLENEAPRDVYVITTARKRDEFDWQEEFYKLGIGPKTGPVQADGIRSDPRGISWRSLGSDNSLQEVSSSSWSAGTGRDDARRADAVLPPVLPTISDGIAAGEHRVGVQQAWEAGRYPYVLTVDSWNNIAKYANVSGAFFIFDEQRLVGSGDWVRKFLRIAKHNHWILLSATPGDTWMDYVPMFIANGFYKNRTEFKSNHVVYNTFTKFPKVDRYINQGKLARHRAQLLVEMKVERHTKRRHVETMLSYDKILLERVLKDRWHVYEDRPLNDVAEMFSVGRRVVNSDPSRLEMVRHLWQQHPRLIVFYNFNYELEALRSLAVPPGMDSTADLESSSKTSRQPSSFQKTKEYLGSRSPSMKTSDMVKKSSPTPPTCETEGSEWTKTKSISASGSRKNSTKLSKASKTSGLTTTSLGKGQANLEGSSIQTIGQDQISTLLVGGSIAEWNGHKHQPVPTSERWIYLVQYMAGAEAWNCITTDAMIMFSQNYSWKIMEQAYGRIDRINTLFRDLWYYGFTSNSFIDQAIARSLKAKENFNEAKYKGLFV